MAVGAAQLPALGGKLLIHQVMRPVSLLIIMFSLGYY